MVVCPECGHENPDGARFCNECATSLDAAPTPRETRKTVTVLFCDVAGYTETGERLDPEALRRLQSRYFDDARVALERHGATVEKFIGDAVMAVFGTPQLHEDDALRAVRAALELRKAIEELGLEARIGINTGEVVAGSGDALVTGDSVNVAARLEQAAEPGVILIGESTQRLLSGAVTSELAGPVEAKGKAEPLRAWRLVDVRADAEAVPRRLDSPLVGREREHAALRQAYDRAAQERSCHLFTILGAAGVGKSRLAAELVAEVRVRARVATGRCLPYGEGITYWPLHELLIDVDDERARPAQELLKAELSSPEELFLIVRKLLETLAREQPLLVVFDDVHWADPTFLDLVDHVSDLSRDAPILLVCLARPDLLDQRPGWGGGKLNATSVLLEPLAEEDCERLISSFLGQSELEQEARSRILEAAEGNPLFVEEMLEMLIDDGLLERNNGSWVASRDLSEVAVPPTIQALLAARLDRLSDEERAVAQRGAVEGKVFHHGAVSELAPESIRRRLSAHLLSLVRKELVRPYEAEFAGEDAYRFRHLLIRDAAYQSLSKADRAQLHERFASWLEGRLGGADEDYEEILGYHLEQAYRCRVELGSPDDGLARRAAARLRSAAKLAAARGDSRGAVRLLERTEALLGTEGREALEVRLELGRARYQAGTLAEAETHLVGTIEAAAEAGEELIEARARVVLLDLRIQTQPKGATEEAQRESERLLPLFEHAQDHAGLADYWKLVGTTHWMSGQAEQTAVAMGRALEHAREAGDASEVFDRTEWLAIAEAYGPTPASAALERFEELVAPLGESRVQSAQIRYPTISLLATQGRFDEARAAIAEYEEVMEELGWPGADSSTGHQEMNAEILAGNFDAAERYGRAAYARLEKMGAEGYLSTTAAYLAQALLGKGAVDEADHLTRISEELGAPDDLSNEFEWRQARAKVLAARADYSGAEKFARSALDAALSTDWVEYQGRAFMTLAQVLLQAGRRDEAAEAAREALARFERKGSIVSAESARELLRRLEPE